MELLKGIETTGKMSVPVPFNVEFQEIVQRSPKYLATAQTFVSRYCALPFFPVVFFEFLVDTTALSLMEKWKHQQEVMPEQIHKQTHLHSEDLLTLLSKATYNHSFTPRSGVDHAGRQPAR